ncbi:MAG: DsbA family protein [Paracoccaceae bacterium]|nr:DsbA family protein [Paracoccaceae bacterium]
MSRLLSLAIALLAPFIVGGWLISQGVFSAAAETKNAIAIVIPDMMQGNADARVTVVEYASFTCPHCASFHAGPYKKLKKDYIDTGKIKFVFREVYFDKVGVWSSLIARCGGPERFFGIADLIFKDQKEWARAGSDVAVANELRKIGRLAGLDGDTLESCLTDSDKITALVGWFKDNTTLDKISSTPSLMINGQKHANLTYDELAALIEEQLAQ